MVESITSNISLSPVDNESMTKLSNSSPLSKTVAVAFSIFEASFLTIKVNVFSTPA